MCPPAAIAPVPYRKAFTGKRHLSFSSPAVRRTSVLILFILPQKPFRWLAVVWRRRRDFASDVRCAIACPSLTG